MAATYKEGPVPAPDTISRQASQFSITSNSILSRRTSMAARDMQGSMANVASSIALDELGRLSSVQVNMKIPFRSPLYAYCFEKSKRGTAARRCFNA